MPTNDFIPSRDADQTLWSKNLRAKIDVHGKALGFTPAQIKSMQSLCDEIVSASIETEKKHTEYKAQVAAAQAVRQRNFTALRKSAQLIKAQSSYSEAIGRDLGIARATASPLAPSSVKASGVAEARKGFVRIKWRKAGCDSVNIYMRRQGDAAWQLLGRDTHSPYDDATPLTRPEAPELREYRITPVRKDVEIGEPSDILSVMFTG
jgi:hypothetical protein